MKVVILAGGFGTRLSEETDFRPKPMIEIGGKPILWHIMKIYSHYGFNEFIICCGYKGYMIKEYFANYFLHQSDVKIDIANNKIEVLNNNVESWIITLLDTGLTSMTGGRVLRAKKYLNNETFLLTYGDGVSDLNISDLVAYHHSHKGSITMTSVQPESRFGALTLDNNNRVVRFLEKPSGEGSWINGGFFVCDARVLDYLKDDSTIFEREPLETMARDGELFTFKHDGFWKSMDTLRDKTQLDEMLIKNNAPWKKW
jgi:glucose-1-phosphate cytidylyltransferase